MPKPTVVVAGLGDTGILVATRLARSCRVVAVTTRPALVSGQELGMRLTDPEHWKRSYFVPLSRFRRFDNVDVHHGRIASVDLGGSSVCVQRADGLTEDIRYEALVIATGVSNGFWRDDRVEDLAAAAARIAESAQRLDVARTIAVVGGGATGASVADNVARRPGVTVHLFFPGNELLPQHHPKVRRWVERTLRDHGVILHPEHRAVLPEGIAPNRITEGPIEWSSGQPPVEADAVVWAVGAVRPHSAFLPTVVLDEQGFVRVNEFLQMPGFANVFAVGDVAASDPLRSSARNWGYRAVVSNVGSVLRGRAPRRRFRAPKYRWGSVFGLQHEGLTVATAKGARFRIPRRLAEPLLYGVFVTRGLYGGLRHQPDRESPTP